MWNPEVVLERHRTIAFLRDLMECKKADAVFKNHKGGYNTALQVRGVHLATVGRGRLQMKDRLTKDKFWVQWEITEDVASTSFLSRPTGGGNIRCLNRAVLDDQLWIVCGCGIPLILRPQGDHHYSLVSPAELGEGTWPAMENKSIIDRPWTQLEQSQDERLQSILII